MSRCNVQLGNDKLGESRSSSAEGSVIKQPPGGWDSSLCLCLCSLPSGQGVWERERAVCVYYRAGGWIQAVFLELRADPETGSEVTEPANCTMLLPTISLLLRLLDYVLTNEIPTQDGCLSALAQCKLDPGCIPKFRILWRCAAHHGVEPFQLAARNDCLIAALALQSNQLFTCKCQRGMKKEKNCLRIYWTMHQSHVTGYDDLEASPYEYSMPGPSWGLDYGRHASLVSEGPKVQALSNVNHCLDAAQACNVDETCKLFRTEYAKNCLKPANRHGCNRPKCRKSLRRFFNFVPEEYKYPFLFCPCDDSVCAERRRQTIVPSCSFEEPDKPNCLGLKDACEADSICKARLVDFQINCQPSKKSASHCFLENYNACLQSYTGLIGTALTPNYVSNTSFDISIWCTCVNSGNQHEECETLLNLFTSNDCLRNSINSYISSLPFHLSDSKQPALTSTQQFYFRFPDKDGSHVDDKLNKNEDCDSGGNLKVSQDKLLPGQITNCKVNSGAATQSFSIACTITSLYIFMAITGNAI
ncbi:GDNF family receptor alpha-4-like isoform X1 [Chiloscyllium punctatum]|uniref:GDNF family receptor alpha-4-like isoform X1 n=1 Tax=Chiloscyllium punctatum TaxID=137246 RepID=UPI003B63594A